MPLVEVFALRYSLLSVYPRCFRLPSSQPLHLDHSAPGRQVSRLSTVYNRIMASCSDKIPTYKASPPTPCQPTSKVSSEPQFHLSCEFFGPSPSPNRILLYSLNAISIHPRSSPRPRPRNCLTGDTSRSACSTVWNGVRTWYRIPT
jgi:hypothetical protein